MCRVFRNDFQDILAKQLGLGRSDALNMQLFRLGCGQRCINTLQRGITEYRIQWFLQRCTLPQSVLLQVVPEFYLFVGVGVGVTFKGVSLMGSLGSSRAKRGILV